MSLRTDMLPVANLLRGIAGPLNLDFRTTTVTIRTRTWSGECPGDGTATDVDLALSPLPKVRLMSTREVASSGGRFEVGDVKVGPITPAHPGGGYTAAQLAPDGADNREVLYVLAGAIQGLYSLVSLNTDKAMSYSLILRRTRLTP